MYLLDTNIISEMRRQKPHDAVVAWFDQVKAKDFHLSAMTIGEIQTGIERTRAYDTAKAQAIEFWADQMVMNYSVLPIDTLVVRQWSKLLLRKSDASYEDAIIAATAIVHGLIVATRDVRDFSQFNIRLINPFDFVSY